MSKNIIVVGGGAAGMLAAYFAAEAGNKVTLLEKNEKLGKKIYITGKGRCNLTNACDVEELFLNVKSNSKFLYSAFYGFDNNRVIDFFESHGMPVKVERGNRVFPVSDKSSDVIFALQRALKEKKVEVLLHTEVSKLCYEKITDTRADEEATDKKNELKITGVILKDGTKMDADAVIVATGGLSYPSTGSTGDGYKMAESAGHTVTECTPSLVPFNVKEEWVKSLQGLSLKNTAISIYSGKKKLYEDFGEMLFTHFGVSGPMILSASASIKQSLIKQPLDMYIDLKPALTQEALDKRLLREFEEAKNKQFKNSINKLLPAKMIPVIIELSGIDPDKKVNEISKEERNRLLMLFKKLPVTLNGPRGYNEAIITKGGIKVKEINPSTMESKLVYTQVGELYGFPIKVVSERILKEGLEFTDNRFVVEGNYKYTYNNGHLAMADPLAAARNFLNAIERIPSIIDQYKAKNEVLEMEIPQLQEIAGKVWKKEDELKQLNSELAALDRKIQLELAPPTPEVAEKEN